MAEVDLDALRRRLAAAEIADVAPLAGGASSLTFRGARFGREVVIKVAPPGVEPVAHRDVLRQARIIKALATTRVPVPEVIWEDPGNPPLFVMSHVDGDCGEPLFDVSRRFPIWPSGTATRAAPWRPCTVSRRLTSGWAVNRSSIRSPKSIAGVTRCRPSMRRWCPIGRVCATPCYGPRRRRCDRAWCTATSG